jgi:hypothetical protein
MDVILSFKKYFENYKLAFSYSVLFIFLLFIIDPFISMFGGTLNLSYNLVDAPFVNMVVILITMLILNFIYSLIQSVLIYKIGKDYHISETVPFKKIKQIFYKLLKFNFSFFLFIFLISAILYDFNILNNILIQLIFLIISVALWFVPQIMVLENESISKSIYLSIKYFGRNWFHFITLFLSAFILIIITSLLDILIPGVGGFIISTGFLVIFVIPFIEILKTEIYLNKYNLLKPRHQLK